MSDGQHFLNALLKATEDERHFEAAQRLADVLERLYRGLLTPVEAQNTVAQDVILSDLVSLLAGKQLPTKDAILYFGDKSNLGDVTINDVAGRDILKITFNVYSGATAPGTPDPSKPPTLSGITEDQKKFLQLFVQQAGEQQVGHVFQLIRRGNRKYLRRDNLELPVNLTDKDLLELARQRYIKIHVSTTPTSIVVDSMILSLVQ